ncbi:hypothetical protein LTR37_015994 [Vermiconidia calcicola]|uniref:Uncharacterized protein n=1 Tax=Vermiconidia calcicola TaxID=1690605 RepID=A0ACC3MQA2_9PEZI|nr:hypothetical protein LTR37_015994 [Vermiconidia calcicola]
MAWFPCFPVQASWDTTILDKKCYFFGARDNGFEFAAAFVSHAASNMTLDLIILLLPTALYFQQDMTRKEIWGVSWLISMGAIATMCAIARLIDIAVHKGAYEPYYDPTYWGAIPFILSILEVHFAIIAASMPVFWPVVEDSFKSIFVTTEITVFESHDLTATGGDVEQDNRSTHSKGSGRALHIHRKSRRPTYGQYGDSYSADPLKGGGNIRTNVSASYPYVPPKAPKESKDSKEYTAL